MMNTNYVTTMQFMTDSIKKRIDLALLSRFQQAEWLEVCYKSTFESDSLMKAIVSQYCENAELLLPAISKHLFDVIYDNEVHLIFESSILPIFNDFAEDHELKTDFYTSDCL